MKRKEDLRAETHAYDMPLLEDDQRWRTQDGATPVLIMDLLRTAELWSVLHPYASKAERRFLASLVANAMGAE